MSRPVPRPSGPRAAFVAPIALADARRRAAVRQQTSPEKGFAATQTSTAPTRFKVIHAAPDRAEFLAWWSALLRRRCGGSASVIAKTFTCTEQTGRYWLDEFACPSGLAVDHAMALWPDDFTARHDLRRAA